MPKYLPVTGLESERFPAHVVWVDGGALSGDANTSYGSTSTVGHDAPAANASHEGVPWLSPRSKCAVIVKASLLLGLAVVGYFVSSPISPGAPPTSTEGASSGATPPFPTMQHPLKPTKLWGKLQAPFPTGAWYTYVFAPHHHHHRTHIHAHIRVSSSLDFATTTLKGTRCSGRARVLSRRCHTP